MERIVKKRIVGLVTLIGVITFLVIYSLAIALTFALGSLFMILLLQGMELTKPR